MASTEYFWVITTLDDGTLNTQWGSAALATNPKPSELFNQIRKQCDLEDRPVVFYKAESNTARS